MYYGITWTSTQIETPECNMGFKFIINVKKTNIEWNTKLFQCFSNCFMILFSLIIYFYHVIVPDKNDLSIITFIALHSCELFESVICYQQAYQNIFTCHLSTFSKVQWKRSCKPCNTHALTQNSAISFFTGVCRSLMYMHMHIIVSSKTVNERRKQI